MVTNNGARIELFNADGDVRTLGDIETDVINLAICLYGGSVSEVSRHLGVGRSTLYRKLERHVDLARRPSCR